MDANDYAIVLSFVVMFNIATMPILATIPMLHSQRRFAAFEGMGFIARIIPILFMSDSNFWVCFALSNFLYIITMMIFFGGVVVNLWKIRLR